ncbi:MAG TPA: PEP-CTERM sorting domain-containing protein [Dongiaceae bacterium]|jgi:hypothetical protein|nr:PEP-CTERM sorting domain-containing protein [Dongiaceae bacterium]
MKPLLVLLAAGGVLLTQLARADEAPTFLDTAVSSTVISGYVNTSATWDPAAFYSTFDWFSCTTYICTVSPFDENFDTTTGDLPQPSDFSQSSISAVPEPATLSLLGLGGLVAGSFIRRRRPVTR